MSPRAQQPGGSRALCAGCGSALLPAQGPVLLWQLGANPPAAPSVAGGARAALEWAEGTWRCDAGRQNAWRGGWRWPWLSAVTRPAHADTQGDNTEPFGTWGSSVGSGVWMESHESQEGPAPALIHTHNHSAQYNFLLASPLAGK